MHSFLPDKIPYDELTPEDKERNFTLAFDAARCVHVLCEHVVHVHALWACFMYMCVSMCMLISVVWREVHFPLSSSLHYLLMDTHQPSLHDDHACIIFTERRVFLRCWMWQTCWPSRSQMPRASWLSSSPSISTSTAKHSHTRNFISTSRKKTFIFPVKSICYCLYLFFFCLRGCNLVLNSAPSLPLTFSLPHFEWTPFFLVL